MGNSCFSKIHFRIRARDSWRRMKRKDEERASPSHSSLAGQTEEEEAREAYTVRRWRRGGGSQGSLHCERGATLNIKWGNEGWHILGVNRDRRGRVVCYWNELRRGHDEHEEARGLRKGVERRSYQPPRPEWFDLNWNRKEGARVTSTPHRNGNGGEA